MADTYPHLDALRRLLAAWRALAKDVAKLEQEIAKAKAKAA